MSWEEHARKGRALEDKGDDFQWRAAEEYQTAHDQGASQQEIAREAQRSQQHISFVLTTLVVRGRPGSETLSFAECYAKAKQKKPVEHTPTMIKVPEGTYTTIVIDPPWQYDNRGTRGAANDHYPTMALEELRDLVIPAADSSHLYLWTTNAFLRDAFDLVAEWKFDYKATLVWAKPQMGMGNYFRISHELILFGTRGGLGTLRKDVKSWFEAPRGKHSTKPDAFYELVEVSSPGPYFDMFNRDGGKLFKRPGWDTWGDEA